MAVVGNLMSDAALEGHYLTHPEPCGVCSKRISSITVVLIKPFAIVDLLHSCHNLFLWYFFFQTWFLCVIIIALAVLDQAGLEQTDPPLYIVSNV